MVVFFYQFPQTFYFLCFRHGSSNKVVEIETANNFAPPLTVPTLTLNDEPSVPHLGAKQHATTSADHSATHPATQPNHTVNANHQERKSESSSSQTGQHTSDQTINMITLDTYQDEHGEPCSAV